MLATTTRASIVSTSMPTTETRTNTSMTSPRSRINSMTSYSAPAALPPPPLLLVVEP